MDVNELIAARGDLLLERVEQRTFVRLSVVPEWCRSLCNQELIQGSAFPVEEVFPFLTVFLEQAEATWRDETSAGVSSDFWTATGSQDEEIHLEASALRVGDSRLLIISRNDRLFEQQQLLLQRARELRLMHDALMRELEQKDILVHTIVHDLAAPLHSILGALSLLSELPLEDPSAQWIGIALAAATRQRRMIGDILEVFSAEHGIVVRSPEGANIPELGRTVAQVLSELEPVARRKSVRIESPPQAPPLPVAADETRLVRVITNLVENALRHSPTGGRVRIATRREPDRAWLAVEDEGLGVPLSLLPTLFDKFARGHGQARSGTGLGLYFCRITVEGWGGGIGYEPREGGGARFWIRLPLAK